MKQKECAMSQNKLKDVWMSGYCRETVRSLNEIGFGPEKAPARIDYIRSHVPECERCRMANIAKGVEHDVAVELTRTGHPSALMLFKSGMDSPVPYASEEYGTALRKVLAERGEGEKEAIEILIFLANLKDGKEV